MNHKQNTASQYDRDLEICEAATEGPWFVANWTDDAGHYFVEDGRQEGLYPIRCEGNEARYIAHFNPTYVTQLIKQAQRCEELEAALLNVACELAESDIENDDGLKELHADVLHVLNKDKVQELLK